MPNKSHKAPITRETKARTRSGLLSLLWIFVGAVIIAMVGVFLYLSPLFDTFKTEVEVNAPVTVKPLPQENEPVQYDFYEVLPKREFKSSSVLGEEHTANTRIHIKQSNTKNIDDEQISTISTSNATYEDDKGVEAEQTTTSQPTYILQVHSYENAEDADNMRANVMMAGVDAQVIRRDSNENTIYQVVSLPMNKEMAEHFAHRLKESGIDTIIVKQKH